MTESLPTLAVIPNFHKTFVAPYPVKPNSTYFGYFENCYGEQWVFTYNYETDRAVLSGGDVSWKEYPVEALGTAAHVDLVLNREEHAWLQACWGAAVVRRKPAAKK
jgi:hypothetical protein